MNRYKQIALASFFLFLNSCATTAKYSEKLQSWIGKTESDLVTSWGMPTSTYSLENRKLLMYRQDFGSNTTAQPIYGTYYMNTTHNWCETTFMLDEKKVIFNFQLKGTSCVSY